METIMNRERFVAEAEQVGIERSAALTLFGRLYPAPERGAELSRDGTPLAGQTRLSRTVQVFVGLGVLLVIGAHAWWSTKGYQAMGIGIVLVLTLLWQADSSGPPSGRSAPATCCSSPGSRRSSPSTRR